jgi:putative DNA primase/helicase
MAVNYDDVMDQLRGHGLEVGHLQVGPNGRGKPWRCREIDGDRERRGWYLLHEWQAPDGERHLVGSYGIWRGADPGAQRVQLGKRVELDADAKAAIRARIAEDKRRAIADREREAQRAATRAARAWSKLLPSAPAGGCDYLARKAVQAYGLRYTDSGALVVPMQDAKGQIHGLQFILPAGHPQRRKLGRDKTYWPAGLQAAGHYHLIGNPAASPVCLVAEGYATAATLHAATALPVAVAFSANNLRPVAQSLHKTYRQARLLICADDDYLTDGNPGQTAAAAAALAVGGAWLAPVFPGDRGGEKLTDYNDLQQFPEGGLHLVTQQIRAKLDELGWDQRARAGAATEGSGDGRLKSLLTIDEACERYSLIYGGKGTLFDHQEHLLVPKQDVLDIMPDHGWRDWKQRPDRRVVRLAEVGFDPTGNDERILCNLWGGWPTVPSPGSCDTLIDLLEFLCSAEDNPRDTFEWVIKWLAYPVQNPGAKMKTALVFHGPQGVGKNLFFEAVMAVYGEYGRIVDQAAIEDKFNDWVSRKLFLVCDEVVARQELFHVKNKLKALITGDAIRINPKNVTPHDERNHVNFVFLSNERQPLVLEKDDRRYCVVWVPDMLPPSYYDAIGAEIKAGGVAALHQYLLDVDLGDFRPWARPPATRAKRELIDVSMESTERFLHEWAEGELEWPFGPCGSMDLYAAYTRWSRANGVARPRESNHFIAMINKRRGWSARPVHIYPSRGGNVKTKTQKMVLPPDDLLAKIGAERSPDKRMADWATDHFFRFQDALHGEQF